LLVVRNSSNMVLDDDINVNRPLLLLLSTYDKGVKKSQDTLTPTMAKSSSVVADLNVVGVTISLPQTM
jgi:hypothetical protein